MITRSWGLLLTPFLLAAAPLGNPEPAQVTGLSLSPVGGEAELVVAMSGAAVRWADFTLDNPSRVVVDITGARSALPKSRYEEIDRAGIGSVRTSQYSADVVRVVVDLERAVAYEVESTPEGLKIRFRVAESFSPWSTLATPEGAYVSAQRDATPAAAPARTGLAAGTAKPVVQVQSQRPITVTFQEADIREVLASFAEFTGRSIVPGAGVEGTVTATIRQQPWDLALQTILSAYGLAAQEMPSGIIQVDKLENLQSRMTQEPLVTRTFRINYVPVPELQESLTPLSSERGNISMNPTTNTLIVTDVPSVIARVEQMVQQLDVRTPQVTIEAKIVFVNRTDAEEMGIVYDLKDRQATGTGNSLNSVHPGLIATEDGVEQTSADVISLTGSSIAALGNANARVQGPQLETLISLVMGRFTLISFIEALQSAELSDVQAAPVVTTLDNQEAEIWVGERTPIRVVDLASGATGGGAAVTAPRATAELVETGIRLRVTPHITADRRILMQMHAERSSAQLAATDIGVVFQTQQGQTRVMVNDGETAVIGGLTVTEVTNTRAGIPYLMNLPYVGRLFRTERKREQKRDLLIMVTPHIVDDLSVATL